MDLIHYSKIVTNRLIHLLFASSIASELLSCTFLILQDVTASTVASLSKGCVWNQDPAALAAQAGLKVGHIEQHCGGLVTLIIATK